MIKYYSEPVAKLQGGEFPLRQMFDRPGLPRGRSTYVTSGPDHIPAVVSGVVHTKSAIPYPGASADANISEPLHRTLGIHDSAGTLRWFHVPKSKYHVTNPGDTVNLPSGLEVHGPEPK